MTCDGALVTLRIEDVDVDQCDACAGIWFDSHELERILRRDHIEPILGRARATAKDDERRGRCPRCKGELAFHEEKSEIHCGSCKLAFPIVDDIPVMLVDEAKPLAK